MTIKQQLSKYLSIMREIQYLEEEIIRLRHKADSVKSISIMPDKIKGAIVQDPTADLIVEYLDETNKLIKKLKKASDERDNIESIISSLPEKWKQLMRLRYIYGMTFERIAVELNYSWRQVHRLHGEALVTLEKQREGKNEN